MTPWFNDGRVTLCLGDSLDLLPQMPAASVDACVTDPPYGIGFMGREWDQPWRRAFNETDAGMELNEQLQEG